MTPQALKDIGASVRARLLNLARARGRPNNELLQYFAIERLLYRLSRSRHRDRFVLKGALMMHVWGTAMARATRDGDLLGRGVNSVERMTTIMFDCCAR